MLLLLLLLLLLWRLGFVVVPRRTSFKLWMDRVFGNRSPAFVAVSRDFFFDFVGLQQRSRTKPYRRTRQWQAHKELELSNNFKGHSAPYRKNRNFTNTTSDMLRESGSVRNVELGGRHQQ